VCGIIASMGQAFKSRLRPSYEAYKFLNTPS